MDFTNWTLTQFVDYCEWEIESNPYQFIIFSLETFLGWNFQESRSF